MVEQSIAVHILVSSLTLGSRLRACACFRLLLEYPGLPSRQALLWRRHRSHQLGFSDSVPIHSGSQLGWRDRCSRCLPCGEEPAHSAGAVDRNCEPGGEHGILPGGRVERRYTSKRERERETARRCTEWQSLNADAYMFRNKYKCLLFYIYIFLSIVPF